MRTGYLFLVSGSLFMTACFLLSGSRYPENPPPAHTGGFGEPTCHACHFDGELNDAGGSLNLLGLEQGYKKGAVRDIEVLLAREDMSRAGFQLSVRFSEGDLKGKQAGQFVASDSRLMIDTQDGIQYIRQSEAGTARSVSDSVVWHIQWRSPDSDGSVIFHAAANAANGDDSEFGDAIYQVSVELASK